VRVPLILTSLALAAACLGQSSAFLTRPDVHGHTLVFTAEGDLWISDLSTGVSHRITSDPGVESFAHFSPDGTQIAFTAGYDGGANVYLMPTAGGSPKRLTFDTLPDQVVGWTPDGKNVLFRTSAKLYASAVETFATQELYSVSVEGGLPMKIAVPKATYASLNADGNTLAFVPDSNEWMNWFRYEGGEADKIWLADLAKGKFEKLTNSKGVDTQPVWVGNTIYFVSERTGIRNLWSLDPSTKKVRQLTFSTNEPVRHPSSDGKEIVFELGPKIAVYDPSSDKSQVLTIQLNSDRIHSRPFEFPVSVSTDYAIGPTGKRVAMVSRGHLVTVPAGEGGMHTVVSDSAQRVQNPVWSPDGKKLAYVSDADGEEQIFVCDAEAGATPKKLTTTLKGQQGNLVWSHDGKYLLVGDRETNISIVDAATGSIKLIAHSPFGSSYDNALTDFSFSPDSKWVAYTMPGDAVTQQVYLYEISSGKSTLVTDPTIISGSPTFSPDGKYLFVLQMRHLSETFQIPSLRIGHEAAFEVTAFPLSKSTASPFAPKDEEEGEAPVKPDLAAKAAAVDLDGLPDRTIDMKVPPGDYSKIVAIPGKLLIQAGPSVLSFDIASKALTPIASGIRALDVSQDGKKILLVGPAGPQVVEAATGPVPPGAGALKLQGLTVTIDPVKEWKQIFNESWRVGRDFFYDPNTHGVDWKGVKLKYQAELPLVADRSDLTQILKDIVSEFNTGHCYVAGPTPFGAKPPRYGELGADLVWDSSGGAYKIAHVLKGDSWDPSVRSPLADPGVNVKQGDYLLKIDGRPLRKDEDPESLLLGTAGHTIAVTTNSTPSLVGSKTTMIVPIANDLGLRHLDWVKSRRAYVTKASGGQIAYVYLPDMEEAGANEFAKNYYPNVNKAGIIIDVRGNGGGNISSNLLSDLATKPTGFFTFRSGGTFRREEWGPMGEVVAVTDQWAFSDGEYFSEFFKRMKIGPLVGHRTGGGEVGSGGGYGLVDGGSIYIPNYGAWVPGEWVVEGRGAVPDYEVDQDPAAVMAGRDPQLDKAIELILTNLKAHPFKMPQHPPFPVKLKGSQGS
jgi:tricorn protease